MSPTLLPVVGSISESSGSNEFIENDGSSQIAETPAQYEELKFECDESVEFWKNFQKDGLYDTNQNLSEVVNVANRFASKGADAMSYWLVRYSNATFLTGLSYVHSLIYLIPLLVSACVQYCTYSFFLFLHTLS